MKQVVINVPDEWLEGTQPNLYDVMGAVMNGVVLPEHHGRLGDLDALYKEMENGIKAGNFVEGYEDYGHINNVDDCLEAVKYAETIIPATDRTATWKRVGSDVHGLIDMYECSNCGAHPPKKQIGVTWGWDFVDCCPKCKAKMILATKEGAE